MRSINLSSLNLKTAGAGTGEIAILVPYKAQLQMLQTMDSERAEFATINSCQCKEYPYVVLDLVNPGGADYHLEFMKDTRRMCVALSRAQHGMVIVGNEEMCDVEWPGIGTRLWQALITDPIAKGALVDRLLLEADLVAFCNRMGIPGARFEQVPPFIGRIS